MHRILILFSLILFISCSQPKETLPPVTQDFCSQIHISDSSTLTKELAPLEEKMKNQTGVYVLEEGGNSLLTRAWLSEHAEKTIDVQYFIFSTDNVGLIAIDYLVRAADKGIKVRILIDDIMVEAGMEEILTIDSHENISIKVYNPGVNLGKNLIEKITKFETEFLDANQRMHNKSFIVDGKVAITGGRNVADEYFDYDHEYNFRDRDVLLLGKVVKNMNTSFDEFWNSKHCVPVHLLAKEKKEFIDSNRFERLHQYACNPENFWPQIREKIKKLPEAFAQIQKTGKLLWLDSVYFVSDVPGKNDGSKGLKGGGVLTDTLIHLIQNAKTSINIQSPYLITTELGKKLFADAVKRGVKIRILTNSLASTDNLEAFSGYQRDRKKLLATGVKLFEFKPDAKERYKIMTGDLQQEIKFAPIFGLHAKSMIIDNSITVIGTFNLDPRSANLNTECVAIIHSNKLAQQVLENFEIDFNSDNSWETTNNFNPDALATNKKRIGAKLRRVVPKGIL